MCFSVHCQCSTKKERKFFTHKHSEDNSVVMFSLKLHHVDFWPLGGRKISKQADLDAQPPPVKQLPNLLLIVSAAGSCGSIIHSTFSSVLVFLGGKCLTSWLLVAP